MGPCMVAGGQAIIVKTSLEIGVGFQERRMESVVCNVLGEIKVSYHGGREDR